MSVDLRNFVQINLNYFIAKPLNRTRDTAVLITCNTGTNAPQGHLNGVYKSLAAYEKAIEDYNATEPVNEIIDNEDNPKLYNYIKCFFNNGGVKLHIIGGYTGTYIPGADSGNNSDATVAAWIYSEVCKLDYTEILITSDVTAHIMQLVQETKSTTEIIPNAINNDDTVTTLAGYKEKIFITSTNDDTYNPGTSHSHDNLVIKYGDPGVEMTAAAYLTQVNIFDSKTVADYCYTIEDVSMFDNSVVNDNDKVVALSNKNFNVVTTLVNATRNVMGNTIGNIDDGLDLMNYYMRILLTQTLTERILTILATKIKYDKSGINKVVNAMTQELNIYKNSGYLNVNDIWDKEDLYYTFNGVDYLVCKRNTPLTSGYKFSILPLSSLTPEQKQAHIFPPIYILISDSISIRQIVISGDIY